MLFRSTIYVGGTDSILRLRLDYEKVKALNVFNSQPVINDVIVSEKDTYPKISLREGM